MGRKKKDSEIDLEGSRDPASVADGDDNVDAAAMANALDKVSAELEQAEREREAAMEQLLRLRADFDNYRRRSRSELGEAKASATIDVVTRWLPVIENLERAEEAAENGSNIDALREGVGLVHKTLVRILDEEGIATIDPRGERYDEQSMEALGLVPHPDVPDGHVIEVVQRGRMLGDRLIQPARVIVSGGPPATAEKPSDPTPDEDA